MNAESPGGGRIVVIARRIDSKLAISVQDDGVGFDCGDFSSSHDGIGLKNVRSRVMTIDPTNTVRIDSKPGVGTMVTIELPMWVQGSEFPVQG